MFGIRLDHLAGGIKPKASVTGYVDKRSLASNESPSFIDSTPQRAPGVLSTSDLTNLMERASAACIEDCLRQSSCSISAPVKFLVEHSMPVPPGAYVTATASYQGREDGYFKFLVVVSDQAGEIAKGTWWRTIVCKENLENTAILRQESPAKGILDRNSALKCIAGRTPRVKYLGMEEYEKQKEKELQEKCRMCYPFGAWMGADLPHNSVSRGFHHAAHHGSVKLMKMWLNSGIDITPYLQTALYAAVHGGQPEVMKLLMRKGADPLTWSSYRGGPVTLLHVAAEGTSNEVMTLLLQKGLDPNRGDGEYFWRPLHYAIKSRSPSMVRLLINAGANPNATDDEGWTSLHFAVDYSNPDLIQLLIDKGADMEQSTSRDTPLMMAVRLGNEAVVRKLLANGCNPSLGAGRCSAHEWLAGTPVPGLAGPARQLRP